MAIPAFRSIFYKKKLPLSEKERGSFFYKRMPLQSGLNSKGYGLEIHLLIDVFL
jgi:hypothetical protein